MQTFFEFLPQQLINGILGWLNFAHGNVYMVGAILVIMMNYRPQGLFGQRRVEVV